MAAFPIGSYVRCIGQGCSSITTGFVYLVHNPIKHKQAHGFSVDPDRETTVIDDNQVINAFLNINFEAVTDEFFTGLKLKEPEIDYMAITRGIIGG